MTSEPRSRALLSLGAFIVLALAFCIFFALSLWQSKNPSLFSFFIVAFLGTLALIMAFRMIYNYKVISTGKGKIEVRKKFLFQTKVFLLEDLIEMEEESIKTFQVPYRLLSLRFSNGFLEISEHEYTNYEALKNYVEKNKPKNKKKK
jgi:uncharacterized membrane protein YbhN (UPF0104 family)